MTEGIVACPSCGKKFRVKEGSGAGSFQCTGCGAAVTYGAAAPAKAAPARAVPAKAAAPAKAAPVRGARPRRSEPETEAEERPARAGRHARGAAHARGRRRGGEDEEGAPPKKSNAVLFVILGVVGLAAAVAIILVVMSGKKGPGPQPIAGQPAGSGPEVPADPGPGAGEARPIVPPPTPAGGGEAQPIVPPPTPAGGTEDPKVPAGGGEEPTSRRVNVPADGNLYDADKSTLRALPFSQVCKDLDHLKDTPDELKQEIDKLCATIVDFNAGGDALRAQDRLKAIGKPAVPKIISALVKCGDYTTREGMINVCFADEVLRSVVGDPAKLNELKAMGNPDKRFIEGTVRGWFIWWYREGYKAEKFDVGGGEGDEEEEE